MIIIILHDDLRKIRLHRNDLLLLRFWPDHGRKFTCKEFHYASQFLCASRQAELIYLCQSPALILCYRTCIIVMHAAVHVAN